MLPGIWSNIKVLGNFKKRKWKREHDLNEINMDLLGLQSSRFSTQAGRLFCAGNVFQCLWPHVQQVWDQMPLPGHFLKANGARWARNSLKPWLEQFRYVLGNNKMISVKGDWPSWTLGNDALYFLAGSWHSIFKRHIQNWTLKAESKWVVVLEMCLTHIFLKAEGKRVLSFWFGRSSL